MFLKRANIQDFRGIKNMDLEFQPGINLLIGDNGAGKTSILEAIAVGLNGLFSSVPGVTASGFQKEDFRREAVQLTGVSSSIVYGKPNVTLEIDADGKAMCFTRKRDDPSGNGRTSMTSSEAKQYLERRSNEIASQLPLFSYMGISRVISLKRADFGKGQKNALNDRRCGYIGSLDGVPSKNSIMEWMQKMAYEAHFQKKGLQEVDFFNRTVAKIMRNMSDLAGDPLVRYSPVFLDAVYKESDAALEQPIGMLSAGYQSILWMAMDITFRLAQLNPTMKDSAEAAGIVLIDEIDMHLHPKWQWKVLHALEDTFPNIQFIIATHAPIVISSCKSGNLISIQECQKVEYPAHAYGYSIEDVVELRQGSFGIPQELKALRKKFDKAYYKNNLDAAQKVYKQMLQQYGADNTEVKIAKEKLDF